MKKILAGLLALVFAVSLSCSVSHVSKKDILAMNNKNYTLCLDFYEIKGNKWGYLKGYEMHSVLDSEELGRLGFLQLHKRPGAKQALKAALGGPQPDYDRLICIKVYFSNKEKDGRFIAVGDKYTILTSTDAEVFGHEIWEALCYLKKVSRCPHDHDLLDETANKWKKRLPDPGYE